MKTLRLLLGNSDGLLNNFIEILARDACADEALLESGSARTVEGFILQGLTGRFDLAIIIPNNLLADQSTARDYDAFSEASQAIGIIKKRCSVPVIALAAFNDRHKEETRLRRAGADRVFALPFHPQEFSAVVRELLQGMRQRERMLERSARRPSTSVEKYGWMTHALPARGLC